MNELASLKSIDGADIEWCKEVKGSMYHMVVEGFQLLSRRSSCIWEQCAWKFSRPCKDFVLSESAEMTAPISDYEKVVRFNYSAEERKALVEHVSYIKSIGSMMQRCDTLVAEALWILSNMRTLSADWMANTSKPESELQASQHGGEENKGNFFYPPTAAQVHCLQFLIYEVVVSGSNMRKPGGLFGNSGSEIPANDLKQLETYFYKLCFFLHILDYTGHHRLLPSHSRRPSSPATYAQSASVAPRCSTSFAPPPNPQPPTPESQSENPDLIFGKSEGHTKNCYHLKNFSF